MSVIVNNTVISNFAVAEQLDLLRDITGEIYTTPEVIKEVEEGIKTGRLFLKQIIQIIKKDDWILVAGLDGKEKSLFDIMPKKLADGERSCLAIALVRGWSFFSDDWHARTYAENNNIPLSGTFGLLNTAVDDKILSEYQADEILQVMIKNNYRSPYLNIYTYRRLNLS